MNKEQKVREAVREFEHGLLSTTSLRDRINEIFDEPDQQILTLMSTDWSIGDHVRTKQNPQIIQSVVAIDHGRNQILVTAGQSNLWVDPTSLRDHWERADYKNKRWIPCYKVES